jgi:hypothetical protein
MVERNFLAFAHRRSLGGHPGPLRPAYDECQSLRPVAQSRGLGSPSCRCVKGL